MKDEPPKMGSEALKMGSEARAEEMRRIRADVMRRVCGRIPLEEVEKIFDEGVRLAEAAGITVIHGSFGAYDRLDPVSCVARTSPLYNGELGDESFLTCEILGWNNPQMWAFISGFDREDGRHIDIRAIRHPDVVKLGEKLRDKYIRPHGAKANP